MSERNKQIEAIQQAILGLDSKIKVADAMNIVHALNGVKDPKEESMEEPEEDNKE